MAQTIKPLFIRLDNSGSTVNDIITVKQFDARSRFLGVILVDENGNPFNLEYHAVFFYALKPDGTEIRDVARITDTRNGSAIIELTDQCLAVPGIIQAEVSIWLLEGDNPTSILTSLTFQINVEKTIRNDMAVQSTNEFNDLVEMMRMYWEFHGLLRSISDRLGVPVKEYDTILQLLSASTDIPEAIYELLASLNSYIITNINTDRLEILDEIKPMHDKVYTRLSEIDDNIYIQTLLQNLNVLSIDWVFRNAPNLGRVLNLAYNLNNSTLDSLHNWNEIKNSENSIISLLSSNYVLTQIFNSNYINGAEFLNIIVKNDTLRKEFDRIGMSSLYSIITPKLANTTYFTASAENTVELPAISNNFNNSGTWETNTKTSTKSIALVTKTNAISVTNGTLYSLDNSEAKAYHTIIGSIDSNLALGGGMRLNVTQGSVYITSRVYTAK